ncbi:MAG: M20/M25/M40 family metallo-hydrolase [Candidatus Thorarchaeota archaeon]
MRLNTRQLLEKLVSFNTTNDLAKGIKTTADCPKYINEVLEGLGFSTSMLESDGFFTSVGEKGEGGFSILFLAHFDVVPVGEGWDSDPFTLRVEGDKAFGRGTCDDKGNIVSMLLLAEQLHQKGLSCKVILAAAGDEEIGGHNGAEVLVKTLQEKNEFPDYIVIADGVKQQIIHRRRNILPTYFKVKSTKGTIQGRRETIRFETDTFGTDSRHSAYLRLGVDRHAMLAASKYLDINPHSVVRDVRGAFIKSNVIPDWVELDIIHKSSEGEKHEYDISLTNLMRALLAINQASFPTQFSDKGTMIYPNMLSSADDIWTLYCDIRSMTNNGDEVYEAFERALKGRVDVLSIEVHAGIGFVDSDPDAPLMRAACWALEQEGIAYDVVEGFGGSDSRYFAGHGSDVFDFGPRGDNLHGSNEWVSLSSLEENARFFYRLIEVLAMDPKPY